MRKKNEFVFNIGFNPELPEHVRVVGILNKLGHTKASYLARAVLFYEERGKAMPGGPAPVDYAQLKQMVRQILEEQRKEGHGGSLLPPQADSRAAKDKEKTAPEICEDDMAGILQALSGFRE